MITPAGNKIWRYNYQFDGKGKTVTFGQYPVVELKEARNLLIEAKKDVKAGIDPSAKKQAQKNPPASLKFGEIAMEFLKNHSNGMHDGYFDKRVIIINKHLLPFLGDKPINEIEPPDLLAVLRRIEAQGKFEMVRRVKSFTGQVFRYAIATGRATRDIAADLKGALKTPKQRHYPSLTEPKDLKRLLLAIDDYVGFPSVVFALKLAPLLFVRPGELRNAQWAELYLDSQQWKIPAEKMKMARPHIVPLSRQALAIIEELKDYSGRGKYLFPGARTATKPISDAALLNALRNIMPSETWGSPKMRWSPTVSAP